MAFCAKCGKELPEGATFCPACGTPAGGSRTPSAPASGLDTLTKDQAAQSYWIERLIAYVVDAVLVFVALLVLGALLFIPFLFTGLGSPMGFIFGPFPILGGIVFVLYFSVTESSSGASFGKRLFKLKVVSKGGSNPTFGEAFVRNISKIYPLLLLLDVILGLALSKGYQQKYADSLVGTSVVRA